VPKQPDFAPVPLATGTDWQAASVTHATAHQMTVRDLIERTAGATSYKLAYQGRAVLDVLLQEGPRPENTAHH
jgi:hypothetical protein